MPDKLTCAICHGSGATHHKTYGTEKTCDTCKGKGKLSAAKAKALGIYDDCERED